MRRLVLALFAVVACTGARAPAPEETVDDDERRHRALMDADPTCRVVLGTGLPRIVDLSGRGELQVHAEELLPIGSNVRVVDVHGYVDDARITSNLAVPDGLRVDEGASVGRFQAAEWLGRGRSANAIGVGPLPAGVRTGHVLPTSRARVDGTPRRGREARVLPWLVVRAVDLDDDGEADVEEREHQCGCYALYSEQRVRIDGDWRVSLRVLARYVADPRFFRCEL